MAPSATLTPARLATAVRRRRPLRIALGLLAVILGLGGIALGGLLLSAAHDTHPVEVDGSIADYQAITINGSYARNDLRLAGDPHTYTFDSRQFHPSLPDRLQKDARVQLWVDQGTTNVLALTLYDEMGLNPTAYTTPAYDNPTIAYYGSLGEAGGLAALGLVLMLGGGVAALSRGRRRQRDQGHAQATSQQAPRGAAQPPAGAGQRVPAVVLPELAAPPANPWSSAPTAPYAPPVMPPAMPPATPPAMPPTFAPTALGAIPTAQAAPTTPMPGRSPAPSRPAAPSTSIDQLPTEKGPALPPSMQPSIPPSAPTPSDAATPWAAWGVAPPPATPPAPQTPTPGTLPDFPTERLPSASPTPPPSDDIGDQPTRKSETVSPPDPGFGA